MALHIFIVEDDADYAELLQFQLLRQQQVQVQLFASGEAAMAALADEPDLVFLDLGLPGQGGIETLRQARNAHPDLPVVIVSAQTDVEVALEAMRMGAYDYVTKGQDDLLKVRSIAAHIAERERLKYEVASLRAQLPARHGLDHIIGESASMMQVFKLIQKTLRGNLTVAILGESGTGKELIAQAIHYNSRPEPGPFVVVNCAAIPHGLMESTFFGHEKGAFTGAHARKIGSFEQADGGTLFLDEIGELDPDLQAKLLRAIQSREITRVGGNTAINFDARLLCATNRDMARMVQEGTFREDLYYRLFQFPIPLPPLRERDQDILLLADHFRQEYLNKHPQLEPRPFSAATRRLLMSYAWPGNVRQLSNAIERALLVSETPEIEPTDLMLDTIPHRVPATHGSIPNTPGPATNDAGVPRAISPDDILPLETIKNQTVLQAYRLCEGNIEMTASRLDISRSTVYRILRKVGEHM